MALLGFLILGVLAGFIAEKITNSDHGLLMNLVVGIAGSFIGGFLAQAIGFNTGGFIGHLLVATGGAVLLLFVLRKLKR